MLSVLKPESKTPVQVQQVRFAKFHLIRRMIITMKTFGHPAFKRQLRLATCILQLATFLKNGALDKRLSHRFFTPESRVRFPYALLNKLVRGSMVERSTFNGEDMSSNLIGPTMKQMPVAWLLLQ